MWSKSCVGKWENEKLEKMIKFKLTSTNFVLLDLQSLQNKFCGGYSQIRV